MPDTTILGHAVDRREDRALLTGAARFLADVPVTDVLDATFIRATVAHARITGVDTSAARHAAGVHTVFDAADLDLPPATAFGREPALARPLLAADRVRYVGEPIAVVLADSSARGADAAELVAVDYDPLRAVTDPVAAIAPDAPLLFPDHGSNVVFDRGNQRDENLFAAADVVIPLRLHHNRVAPVTIEPNGVLAVPGEGGRITVWVSTQSVFGVQREIASALGVEPSLIRVVAPAVGGGFGAKGGVYPEHVVVAALAARVQRPVRWVETRSENMLTMTHGRSSVHDIEIGAMHDGRIVALRVHDIADTGAYPVRGVFIPFVTRVMASGVYRIPKIEFHTTVAVTNATPTGPYRGAGRPEAAALCERSVDVVATTLGIDPVDVRRRNFIPSDAFPYTTATGTVYDTGDYEAALDKLLQLTDYTGLRAEQRARRDNDDITQLGIGVSCYAEVSGQGSEFGSVTIERDGSVTVITGSVPHGQGHETAWAQIASAVLGVPMSDVQVLHSDTDVVARGTGTFGSRSLQLGGSAVHNAATDVLERARAIVADMLEADAGDVVVFEDGRLGVAGAPAVAVTWAEVAKQAAQANVALHAALDFEQGGTFPFGAHLAVVELDTDTGALRLRELTAVDDCGRVINPKLVEGQVHGGLAQGIAQVMFEGVAYDSDGNPVTASLVDYAIPSAADYPSFTTAHTETPTPRNPLGAKGIGESGTTGSVSAVWNAVVDALSPFGITHLDPPFHPERVWRAMQWYRHAS